MPLLRFHQPVQVHHEIAHPRIVDGGLGLAAPGFKRLGLVGEHANHVDLVEILELGRLGVLDPAAEDQVKELLRHMLISPV